MKKWILAVIAFTICACVTTYPSIDEIDRYDSKDHEIIMGMISTLQSSLNSRDVEKWFGLYSDDATITYVKNRPTPKKEVVAAVRKKGVSSWNFIIGDVKIIDTKSEKDRAIVKTILKMKTGGTVKNHPETYYFSKTSGTWLIEKETNP